MITHKTLSKVRTELDRYDRAEGELQNRFRALPSSYEDLQAGCGCIESAALKRASMDLSRALIQLRMHPRRINRSE